jgi:uncharacterized membrane protein YeaQ/YmgE (transglycosylase-associated protein family)
MGLLSWIDMGLIAGWLVGQVVKHAGYGGVGDVLRCVVGALVGGFAASAVLDVPNAISGIYPISMLAAFAGAACAVLIVRATARVLRARRTVGAVQLAGRDRR